MPLSGFEDIHCLCEVYITYSLISIRVRAMRLRVPHKVTLNCRDHADTLTLPSFT